METPDIVFRHFTDFSATQADQIRALGDLYSDWNQKINVVSRKDMDHFYLHHVLHSFSIATTFTFRPGSTILDLGCGGGFPGLPLAIYFPKIQFLLVDSIRKKLHVVEEIAKSVGITNIQVIHSRVEDLKNRKVDTVVSRAVAPLGDLWRWSKPLLRKKADVAEDEPNGLICLKGGDLTAEIQQSGCKPYVWELEPMFADPYFQEKYMLYQPIQ